jgi:HEPN domain-containing protein
MRKAAGDEAALARLVEDEDIPDDVLGFHAQQAVEKLVKAVLAKHGVSYERTHNLTYLLTLLEGAEIPSPPGVGELPTLTPWATEFRYRDVPEASLDRGAALSLVEQAKAWATEQVAESPEREPEEERRAPEPPQT